MVRLRFSVVFLAALAAPAVASARPMVFQEEIIEVEVQKPEVAVYITRQNLNKTYDLELKESFLPRIVQALDEAPF